MDHIRDTPSAFADFQRWRSERFPLLEFSEMQEDAARQLIAHADPSEIVAQGTGRPKSLVLFVLALYLLERSCSAAGSTPHHGRMEIGPGSISRGPVARKEAGGSIGKHTSSKDTSRLGRPRTIESHQVRKVRELLAAGGKAQQEIAAECGVSSSTVRRINKGQIYEDV